MRKIRIIEHISLDGVIQGPGGPEEDSSNGFKYGGWSAPHNAPEGGAAIVAAHGDAFDLLLGRCRSPKTKRRTEEKNNEIHLFGLLRQKQIRWPDRQRAKRAVRHML